MTWCTLSPNPNRYAWIPQSACVDDKKQKKIHGKVVVTAALVLKHIDNCFFGALVAIFGEDGSKMWRTLVGPLYTTVHLRGRQKRKKIHGKVVLQCIRSEVSVRIPIKTIKPHTTWHFLQFFNEYPVMGGHPLLLEWHGWAMISRIIWEFAEGFLESRLNRLGWADLWYRMKRLIYWLIYWWLIWSCVVDLHKDKAGWSVWYLQNSAELADQPSVGWSH